MTTTTARMARIGPPPGPAEAMHAAGAQARAHRLCIAAEPHTDVSPCERHVREACIQLHPPPSTSGGDPGFWI